MLCAHFLSYVRLLRLWQAVKKQVQLDEFMPSVNVSKHGFEKALRQFKRQCEKAGLISRARAIQRHEKPSQKRKRMRAAAVKRQQKKIAKQIETMERERTRH